MRIKEVEKRTGLTAKAIRLYESKGLLNVARQTENDYRDYTEEDVERLKAIAFLREMDISISGIKDWVDGKLTMQDLMRFTAGKADNEEEAAKLRGDLAREALKLMEADPELDLMTAIEEVQTLRELKQEIDGALEQLKGDLLYPVKSTVIALGPIGWTVLNILSNRTEDAIWSFALSIPAVIYVAFRWAQYFRVSKSKRSKAGCLPSLLLAVFCFCFAIGLMVFVEQCQISLFISNENALFIFRQPWMYITLLVPIGELILGFMPAVQKEKREEKLGWKGWVVIVIFNLVLFYGAVTAVSVCTPEGFTRHSFFDPMGTTYTLEDVERVEAGFHGKGIALLTGYESGDFYYKITFSDGKTEDWALCTPVDDEADSWQALLELDAWIMTGDAEKIANDKNREHFMYDQECLDVCDAILNNK